MSDNTLFKVPEGGCFSSMPGVTQSVWLVLVDKARPESQRAGCDLIPTSSRVLVSVCFGHTPALMDGNAGKLWQCTQFDLTEAGAFLMCDLVEHVGGHPVILTLTECTAAEPAEATWIN
jgi:hypothetical protein